MKSSIYSQMAGALAQMTKYAERTILFRGRQLACVVLQGDEMDVLAPGGLQGQYIAHVKILRSIIDPALGQGGAPKSNELVTFPAVPEHGLTPRQLMTKDLIVESFAVSFGLVDPSQ